MLPCPKHYTDPNNQLAQCCFVMPGNFSCCSADNSAMLLIVNHDQRQDFDHAQACWLQTTSSTAILIMVLVSVIIIWRRTVHKREVLSHSSSHSFTSRSHTGLILFGCFWRKGWTGSGVRSEEGGRKEGKGGWVMFVSSTSHAHAYTLINNWRYTIFQSFFFSLYHPVWLPLFLINNTLSHSENM